MDDEKIMDIAEPFLKPVGDHWCFENAIRDNGDIEDFAKALLAAKDQRIAELESLIDEANHLIGAYQKGAENVTRTINRLQAEQMDTESLEDIIEYGGGCLQKHTIREAQAILDLRRKNKEADHAND